VNTLVHIDSCTSFFNHLEYEKRYSSHTLNAYRSDIEQFIDFLIGTYGEREWSGIRHHDIRSWMVDLVDIGITSRTIARKLSSLRRLFHYFKQTGLIDASPMLKIQLPKIAKTLPETVRSEQLERLFDTIDMGDVFEFRNRLIIELFYSTGIRRSELMELKDSSIDKALSRIKVLGKGNKERYIPLSKELLDKLDKWKEDRDSLFCEGKENFLFLNDKGKKLYPKWLYNMVCRYLTSVTSKKKRSPHVLRHSFATHLMDGGAQLNAVKELLGHASLAATQIYTHNSVEKLKMIYKTAHPRSHQKT
jgi:integrase/recombinase XerC